MDMARSAKTALKRGARRFGYEFVRQREPNRAPLDVLSYVIAEVTRERGPLSFLQVGANDGVRADPIHALITRFGMSGVLVEPLPDMFAKLVRNYSGVPGLSFEQCAVAPVAGEVALYRVDEEAPLPDWVQGMASMDRGHLTKFEYRFPDIGNHIRSVTVPARTIESIVDQHGLRQLDFLQVDTEGFDCSVVMMALDSGLRPAVVNYEYCHAPQVERVACKGELVRLGYRVLDVGLDTLAVLTP